MDAYKLFESTVANFEPDQFKDMRRDQLLDYYDDAIRVLETLVKTKESEVAYRKNLYDMLEKSKKMYDNKLNRAQEEYQATKKHAPNATDHPKNTVSPAASSSTSMSPPPPPPPQIPNLTPPPVDNNENRSSLDRRLSEFIKTFPNLTQAGIAPPTGIQPQAPGYYTQQPPPLLPTPTAPPSIELLRFPPPPMAPMMLPQPHEALHRNSQFDRKDMRRRR